MKIVIATGGTGGHIYPAIALADAAKKRYEDCEILFIGNDNRMETRIVPEHGYAFKGVHASGLTGSVFNKVKAVLQMFKARSDVKKILKEFQPDVAIGFGGYVSAPVLMAANSLGIKTMIHEQNSVVGKANMLMKEKVDGIVICYEKCFEQMPREKTRLLGNPRGTLAIETPFDEEYYNSFSLDRSKPTVLIVMGSLGSASINDMMIEMLPEIKDCNFLFVTGKQNYEEVKARINEEHIIVVDYIKQLDILKGIDLIVCRAGATTLAEITALGTPSILVPSPYVAHNHQFYNASVLVDNNCAKMIEEKDLNKSVLYDKINQVIHDKELMKTMKENSLRISFPNASEDILDYIEEIVG